MSDISGEPPQTIGNPLMVERVSVSTQGQGDRMSGPQHGGHELTNVRIPNPWPRHRQEQQRVLSVQSVRRLNSGLEGRSIASRNELRRGECDARARRPLRIQNLAQANTKQAVGLGKAERRFRCRRTTGVRVWLRDQHQVRKACAQSLNRRQGRRAADDETPAAGIDTLHNELGVGARDRQ